tara:strand:+ start:272 stop:1204 length:933 start_codon:yes stop_codon:yes gene_type:complete
MPRISQFKYPGRKNTARRQALKRAQRAVNKKYPAKAYKPGNKRRMMARRAPFVETKSKTHEDLVDQFPGVTDETLWRTHNTEHAMINPLTFYMWKRGMEENECIGNSVFAKYLKMKIGIQFPQSAFVTGGLSKAIPLYPQTYELVWGWVPNPFNLTGNTTPVADQATIHQLMEHVNHRVTDYFNEQKDKLRFIPKSASTIRITGRRKVRPDLRYLSTAPPQTVESSIGTDYTIGTIPEFRTSISWKMNKKLHLQPSSMLMGTTQGLYPNFGTWLPFATLISWDYDSLPLGEQQKYLPAIQYNDCIWYSDS